MALGGRDVLRLIVDADSSGTTREFDKLGRGIKSSIGDADKEISGFTKKLGGAFDGLAAKSPMVSGIFDKMGLSGQQAATAISAAIPAATVVAAGAIGAFAVSSINDFQKTALAADKFRDATGLSLDESSKWIAVADDVGVGAGTMQTAFLKMEKAIDQNRTAFGDLIATTSSGATDLGATFLNVVTHLQGIKDPIDRANEASKLFGRGFAEVSEIITTDAEKLKTALKGVGEEQIIDEAEVQKARDFQAAMDELGETLERLKLRAGETLIPIATGLANMVTQADGATAQFGGIAHVFDNIAGAVVPAYGHIKTFLGAFDEGGKNASASFNVLAGDVDRTGEAVASAAADMDLLAGATGAAGAAAEQAKTKFDELRGGLSMEEATLNLQDSFANVGNAAIKAFEDTASGAAGAEGSVRDHQQAVVDLKQRVLDYGEEVADLPPEVLTDILALIDQGKLDEAETALTEAAREREADLKAVPKDVPAAEAAFTNAARTRQAIMNAQAHTDAAEGGLNNTARSRQASIVASANTSAAESQLNTLTRTRNATINVQIQQRGGAGFSTLPAFAEGGMVPGPTGRAQLAVVHGGEMVVPADVVSSAPALSTVSGGAGRNYNITVNAGVGDPVAIGRAVKQAVAAAERAGVN